MKNILKINMLLIGTVILLSFNMQQAHADSSGIIDRIDGIITKFWRHSDVKERSPELTKVELFRKTYCYYLGTLGDNCKLDNYKKENDEDIKIVALRKEFESAAALQGLVESELEVVFDEMPLPFSELGDKSMRIINVSDLVNELPLEISVDNGVAKIKVRHLILKNRDMVGSSNVMKGESAEELANLQIVRTLQEKDLSKIIIDLADVNAADLPVVFYFIAQFINDKPSKNLHLVEYKGVEVFGSSKSIIYSFKSLINGMLTIRVKESVLGQKDLEISGSLRKFSSAPLEIKVNEKTRGYVELIPIILKSLNKNVTVTGKTSGSVTAEVTLGEDVIGTKGKEFIFSGGDLLVTDGTKPISRRFKGFEEKSRK